MKRFRLGEYVKYRPLECGGQVIEKGVDRGGKGYIIIKLSQPNTGNKNQAKVNAPYTLVEH